LKCETEEDKQKLYEFAINRKLDGGLELLLPGAYYDIMKEVQKEHLDTEHYDEFGAE
jgi:hypothetical protein